MQVTHYTDPGCPFAFSAEPCRMQLRWHYGDQLEWRTVMVVIAESAQTYVDKGFTPAKQAESFARLQAEHGMPIATGERPRMSGTEPACRAVVAARLEDQRLADALLRRLRVRTMAGELLDEPQTVDGAARDVGIDPEQLRAWMERDEVEVALRADMHAAREPLPPALVLDHKLAHWGDEGGRRYTCPSYELRSGDAVVVAPGFQPWATYDVLVANLEPGIERRPAPETVDEVLEWAEIPLATAEVAALRGISRDDARSELEAAGATFVPIGEDGYWSAASG